MEMMKFFNGILVILPMVILTFSVVLLMLFFSFFWNSCINNIIVFFGILLSIISIFFIDKIKNFRYFIDLIQVDEISKFSIFFILISGLYSFLFFNYYKNNEKKSIDFFLFLLLSMVGGILIAISCHVSTLFIGIELLFLSSVGLISCSILKENILISIFSYIILSIFSSLVLLLGSFIMYSVSGSLCFSDIGSILIYYPTIFFGNIMYLGFSLIFLSFFLKLSFFPLHFWMPDIYEKTDSAILIFFSLVSKISIFSFLMHFLFNLPSLKNIVLLFWIFKIISIISIFFGNFLAFFQHNIHRLIGYSSITHIGWLLFFFINMNSKNHILIIKSIYIYFIGYILSIILFFCIKSIVESNINFFVDHDFSSDIFDGLFWKNSLLGILFLISLFSLSGFPFTLGFWGKFYILRFILKSKNWFYLIAFFISNIIAIQCYLSIISNVFNNKYVLLNIFKKEKIELSFFKKNFISLIGFFIIFLGLFPAFII